MSDALELDVVDNRIRIIGGLSVSEFRVVTAAIYRVIHDRGYQDVILDFSACMFTHAPPMVALICAVCRHNLDGVGFSLILPNDLTLRKLFLNSNWAHFIDPTKYETSVYEPRKHNPVKQFKNFDDQAQLVNEVMDTILCNLTDFDRSHLTAIEWSLNEITDNVLVHANSDIGGFIQVTAQKSRRMVEFAVADGGVGIANSLRSGHLEITSDVDALYKAIQEGVTRDKRIGQGNGLYGTYKIAVGSSGTFSIHANHSTLYFARTIGVRSKQENIPFHGSLVNCGIDYTNPLLLEDVLRFNDKPHIPVDRIDLKYDTGPDGSILFEVIKETSSVGSRVAGAPVRTKLDNLIRISGGKQITVDFSGVPLISSSFADEVFGKLFVSLGALEFSSKFRFINTDQIVKKLVDKAIMQRLSVS